MHECPYCGSELRRNGNLTPTRSSGTRATKPGRKNTGAELVSCPDCDGVIGGYSPH